MLDYGDFTYLEVREVLLLHAAIFDIPYEVAETRLLRFGGLESALIRPMRYYDQVDADLALQAAALTHGVAENQPFEDGNKRTAKAVCFSFVEENGYTLVHVQDALADWILDL